ncbi:MAG: Mrp/NBP35 family ATP-binding protein [Clostridia bacterium]|nr:Mrp/NBP35 family ATP-binding protein [Clostridia bacterium]
MENDIKNVVAVMSGKGGVGKSSITGMLAVSLADKGYKVGILDGDITGPSIPKIFGLSDKRATRGEQGYLPVSTVKGIKVLSINLMLEDEDTPVIWRGPLIAGVVKQFWEETEWGQLDYLLIDLPPGTGDVPLTVMQSMPVNGLVIVSSPQDLVSIIVRKAVNMSKQMNIPITGIVENLAYVMCPDCGTRINIFGESHLESISKENDIEVLGRLPVDLEFVKLCDEGKIELVSQVNPDFFKQVADNFLGNTKIMSKN